MGAHLVERTDRNSSNTCMDSIRNTPSLTVPLLLAWVSSVCPIWESTCWLLMQISMFTKSGWGLICSKSIKITGRSFILHKSNKHPSIDVGCGLWLNITSSKSRDRILSPVYFQSKRPTKTTNQRTLFFPVIPLKINMSPNKKGMLLKANFIFQPIGFQEICCFSRRCIDFATHRIHVRSIYLHLPQKAIKCR